MNREELLRSEGYWIAKMQTDLYRELTGFMQRNNMNASQLAEYLGCSKGYVSQLLNGNFDHKISKMVELSLAIGKVPVVSFTDVSEYMFDSDKSYSCVCRKDEPSSSEWRFPIIADNSQYRYAV